MSAEDEIRALLQRANLGVLERLIPLAGGSVAEVYRVERSGAPPLVAKRDADETGALGAEARMLRFLNGLAGVPVPPVRTFTDRFLIMDFVAGEVGAPGCDEDAADQLLHLHSHRSAHFGFREDTVIGGLRQANPPKTDWPMFFWEERIAAMADSAVEEGRLPLAVRHRLEASRERLIALIPRDVEPALVHGDVWSGNVLGEKGRITAFLDPALYYGHREVDLAFVSLFRTFGDVFFTRYDGQFPLTPSFWSSLRHVYNLYPLLVHVRLFGGGYVAQFERTLLRAIGASPD